MQQPALTWNPLPAGGSAALMFTQGVAVGLRSGVLSGYAIPRLGAEVIWAIGWTTPGSGTRLAAVLLSERIELTESVGSIRVTARVICLGGVLNRKSA